MKWQHLFSSAVVLGVVVACGVEVGVEGKACPCGEGYVCDQARDLCVRPESLAAIVKPACDPCSCKTDAECTDATRPFCAPASKTCVECNPAEDRCPAGTYCNAKFQCTAGCRASDDCAKISPSSPLCATDRHQCVTCLTAAECGGKSCSPSGACVETCSDTKPCASGQQCCGSLCLDVTSDVLNCGGCGVACKADNGSPSCNAGTCASSCASGFEHCGSDPGSGCETSIRTDPNNCGGCGKSCSSLLPHVEGTACASGKCSFTRCEDGWGNFDKDAANGCEQPCGKDNQQCCPGDLCSPGLSCNGGSHKCK